MRLAVSSTNFNNELIIWSFTLLKIFRAKLFSCCNIPRKYQLTLRDMRRQSDDLLRKSRASQMVFWLYFDLIYWYLRGSLNCILEILELTVYSVDVIMCLIIIQNFLSTSLNHKYFMEQCAVQSCILLLIERIISSSFYKMRGYFAWSSTISFFITSDSCCLIAGVLM